MSLSNDVQLKIYNLSEKMLQYVLNSDWPNLSISLSSILDEIITAEDFWDRDAVTSTVSLKNAGDSLAKIAIPEITSYVTDGAGAIGFSLDTDNALTTDGSRILSVQNNAVEQAALRRGLSVGSWAGTHFDLNNPDGSGSVEFSQIDATYGTLSLVPATYDLYSTDDWAWGAGYNDTLISLETNSGTPAYAKTGVSLISTHDAISRWAGLVVASDPTDGSGDSFVSSLVTDGTDTGQQFISHADYAGFGGLKTDLRWYVGVTGHALAGGRDQHLAVDSTGRLCGASGVTHGAASTHWDLLSLAVDDAAAIGFNFDTLAALTTDGSRILSVRNNAVDALAIRQGVGLSGSAASMLAELFDNAGTQSLQIETLDPGVGSTVALRSALDIMLLSCQTVGGDTAEVRLSTVTPRVSNYAENATGDWAEISLEPSSQCLAGMYASTGEMTELYLYPEFLYFNIWDAVGTTGVTFYADVTARFSDEFTYWERLNPGATGVVVGLADDGSFWGLSDDAGSGDRFRIRSNAADLASTEAFEFDTKVSLADPDALLATWRNSGVLAMSLTPGGTLAAEGRTLGQKGSDVASANDITLGLGNYFDITGNTEVQRILGTGWRPGSVIILQFDSNPTVKHNVAAGADYYGFQLSGAGDFAASAGDTLMLVFDGAWWREVSRTVI